MSSIFKSPPKPKPIKIEAPNIPLPSRSDAQDAAGDAVRRLRQRGGRASTIVTALSGELPSGSVVRKALLGGN